MADAFISVGPHGILKFQLSPHGYPCPRLVSVSLRRAYGLSAEGAQLDEEQDYSSFFSEPHTLPRVEDEVRDSLDLFFTRRSDVKMEGAVVTSDDSVIFVSVIYRPTQRFALFRFKKTTDEIEVELYR